MKRKKLFFTLIVSIVALVVAYSAHSKDEEAAVRINPGDSLVIAVYGEPSLARGITVRVSNQGIVKYPILGEIDLEGLTAEEAAKKIELELKDYMKEPQVSVFIAEHAKFALVGAVVHPKSYELEGPVTLSDAIAFAGGALRNAKLSEVKVIRKQEGGDKEYVLDVESEGADFQLKPFDIVIVDDYGMVSVLGQVKRPGKYYLQKGFSVVDVISLAGGFTDIANRNGVRVIREEEGKKKVSAVSVGSILSRLKSKDIVLKDGDVIFVTESWL